MSAPYPFDPAECARCGPVLARLDAATRAEQAAEDGGFAPPDVDWDRLLADEQAIAECQELHQLCTRVMTRNDRRRPDDLIWPAFDESDGRPVLREPSEGNTEQSIAFFALNRHRFSAFVVAEMRDYAAKPFRIQFRLLDDAGRVIELRGCTAGYGGTGPMGTIKVLVAAGFGDRESLYPIVTGREAFRLERRHAEAEQPTEAER